MKDKKVRKLKVYGAVGKWYKEPPKILLKGQWLERLGFDCGDHIEVICSSNKPVIKRISQANL